MFVTAATDCNRSFRFTVTYSHTVQHNTAYFQSTFLDHQSVQVYVSEDKGPPNSFTCVTVDVVAVIEVLVIKGRTGCHQLLQPHLSDEEAARQVEMLQDGKPSALRQSPETQKGTSLQAQRQQQWDHLHEHC